MPAKKKNDAKPKKTPKPAPAAEDLRAAIPWAAMVTWHMTGGELVAILRNDDGKGIAAVAFGPAPRDVVRMVGESINAITTTGEEGEFVEIGFTEANIWGSTIDDANRRISSLTEALRQIREAVDAGRHGDAGRIARAMTMAGRDGAPKSGTVVLTGGGST